MKRLLHLFSILLIVALPVAAGSVEKIYFGDTGHDKIRRCGLDGTNIEELVTTGLEAVGVIAVDRTGGKMYWADWPAASSNIKRADLDGANVETLLTGLGGPFGIAVDEAAGKIYWTEFSAEIICRADLDGSNVDTLISAGLQKPQGIALDLAGGKMYFCDGSSQYSSTIRRANLDGSNMEILIAVGTGIIAPMEIELDVAGGKMYFTDIGVDSVMRANLDGSNLEGLVASEFGTSVALGLDLSAGKMYFTDFGGLDSELKRANLDGTGVEDLITTGIGAPYGLDLGPAQAECGNPSLNGPWIAIVSGVETYDYNVFMIFNGLGTITEMGAFSVPDPAGTYAVAADCSVSGTLWTDGYSPFTGYISSDSTAEFTLTGLPSLPLMKVSDPGALEECWTGSFVEDSTLNTWDVTLNIDASGTIQSATGLAPPVSGKMFSEDGYLAGLIEFDLNSLEPQAFMLLDAHSTGDSILYGTFGSDCDVCPLGTFFLTRCDMTGVPDGSARLQPRLYQNYPNPFNPSTTIRFHLPVDMPVRLAVFSPDGRLVKSLVDTEMTAGYKKIRWNGINNQGQPVGSGVYFYRLQAGGIIVTKKMVLLK